MLSIHMHLLRNEGMLIEVGEVDNIIIMLFINPFLFVICIILYYVRFPLKFKKYPITLICMLHSYSMINISDFDDFVMSIVSLNCPVLIAPSVFSNVHISKACWPIYHRFVLVLNVLANFKLINTKNIFNVQFQLTHFSIH
jgi:hypothetical protein